MDISVLYNLRAEISLLVAIIVVLVADIAIKRPRYRLLQGLACVFILLPLVVSAIPFEGQAFGGMYYSSPITSVIKTVLTLASLIVFMQTGAWLSRDDMRERAGEFYIIIMTTLLGAYFMVSAGSMMMLYVGLELASIPLACLAAFDKFRHTSAEAGAKFILNSMFSSAMMLYGVSFLFATCGTTYFADMHQMLTASPLQIMAMVLFLAGLGFKLSLVPFHAWTPDVYQGAPTPVSAYLSVVSKGAAAFTLVIVLKHVFPPMADEYSLVLSILIVASITVANLFAILQHDLKRFMAYSSISQAGYIVLAALDPSPQGMASLVYYVFVYVFANMAIFGAITAIEAKTQAPVTMDTCRALYSTNPKLSFVMTIALFSLAGIPPFAGFFSKFFVFAAAFKAGHWIVVFIALINTVVSLYYYMLIVKAIYISPSDEPLQHFRCRRPMRWSLLLCTLALMVVGLCSAIYTYMFNAAQI